MDTTSLMGGGGGYAPQQQQQYTQNKMPSIDQVLASTSQTLAGMGGAPLASRDIPMSQYPQQQLDPAVQSNYAGTTLLHDSPATSPHPGGPPVRYIESGGAAGSDEYYYDDEPASKAGSSSALNLDDTYNKLQAPIFLAVLFFIFQLPAIKKWQFNYIPFAFTGDGNLNVGGIVINSVVFGGLYFLLQRFLAL